MYQITHKNGDLDKKVSSRYTKPNSPAPMISQPTRSLFSVCGTVQRQDAAANFKSIDNSTQKKSLFNASMVSPFQDETRVIDVPKLTPLPHAFPVVQRTPDLWLIGGAITALGFAFYKLLSYFQKTSGQGNDASTKPSTSTSENSSFKTKESEGGKVGDCLYTAVNLAIGNADANEDEFRQIATAWLVTAADDIINRIEAYGGIDEIINVISTPQEWAGDEGDLAPYVLALALNIRLNIHVVGQEEPYRFNEGGERTVDVYYYANHYTHTPTSHHQRARQTKATPAPQKTTPVESISKTVPEMSISEEIPTALEMSIPKEISDEFAEIRDQLRELEAAISEFSDNTAIKLREKIQRAIGANDPYKAFLRLSDNVKTYIRSKSKPQDTSIEVPPAELPKPEPQITFTPGYIGGSITKTRKGSGNKKGRFVGDFDHIHIHIVGNNTHLQIGSDRYDIRTENYREDCEAALRVLIQKKNRRVSGYNDCLRWLCKELDYDHNPFL